VLDPQAVAEPGTPRACDVPARVDAGERGPPSLVGVKAPGRCRERGQDLRRRTGADGDEGRVAADFGPAGERDGSYPSVVVGAESGGGLSEAKLDTVSLVPSGEQ
jgi:hypothetical protein